jgi:hypothetical protein
MISVARSVRARMEGKARGIKSGNWIQTAPSKGWFTILCRYSTLQPFFDKSWRPTEIELVK